jgi:acyl-CoA thioester hydrolase
MSEAVTTYSGVVHPWHCDFMGHMNVTWYVSKFDEATWVMFSMLGITRRVMQESRRAVAALEQNLCYKRELRAGDTVTVRTKMLEVSEKTIRYRHEMVNNDTGEIAATTTLTSVYFDSDARKACPLPEHIRARAQQMADPQDH